MMMTEEGLDLRRTTREEKAEQIRQAAFMFARVTRDVNEIAAALGGVSSRTVQRLMNNPAFHAELDRLGYQGDRGFQKAARAQRQDERKQKPEYQRAKQLWHEMTDIPEHRRAKAIADRDDITVSDATVRRWIRDWRHKKKGTSSE